MVIDSPIVSGSYNGTGSFQQRGNVVISGSLTVTGPVIGSLTGSVDSASFATTSLTSSFANNFTVAGQLIAQTINVQTITSSVDFVTGSTRFGSLLSNTHQFTGSVGVTGSLSVNGTSVVTGTGTSGQVAYFGGTNAITSETNLFWDASNDRLSIGTNNTASAKVRIQNDNGSVTSLLIRDGGTPTANLIEATSNAYGNSFILNAVGNLGLGVTPSAWNAAAKSFDINLGSLYAFSANIGSAVNAFFDTTGWKYKQNGHATVYNQDSGTHAWYNAPSGTAGNAISFTQAMTLDASGRLLLNNTTNYYNYQFQTRGQGYFYSTANDTGLVINPNGTFTNIQGVVPSSGNVEDITLQAAGGNVGIGTTNPSYLLQVQNGDIAIGNGNQTSGNFSQAQSLHFLNEGTVPLATIKAVRTNWAQGRTDLTFSTYDSGIFERMRITSGGQTLLTSDVAEQFVIRRASNNNQQLILARASGHSYLTSVTQGTGFNPLALNPDGGNVLIGTLTDAGQRLQVNGSANVNGNTNINGILSVQPTQTTNINVNTQTTIYTNFPVGKTLIFSVQINWQNNGAAQQSFLIFAGATNTAWGTPNSGVNVFSSFDWSQGFAGGTASFAITGSGTSRNLAVTMSNASTYPVTVSVALITN